MRDINAEFMESRREIPGQIAPELDQFLRGVEREFPGIENLDQFRAAIEGHLQVLYGELQDEIDRAINAGDMGVLAGLKARVLGHEVVGRLVKNPFVDGSRFQAVLLDALADVEKNLTA